MPILAIAANAYAEDLAKCIAAVMNDSIGKPYSASQMLGALLKWLERKDVARPAIPEAQASTD